MTRSNYMAFLGRELIYEALNRPAHNRKAARLHDAECLYRAVRQVDPGNPNANHNLDALARQAIGAPARAFPHFRIVAEVRLRNIQFRLGYLKALIYNGQINAARKVDPTSRAGGLLGATIVDPLQAQIESARQAVGHVTRGGGDDSVSSGITGDERSHPE